MLELWYFKIIDLLIYYKFIFSILEYTFYKLKLVDFTVYIVHLKNDCFLIFGVCEIFS